MTRCARSRLLAVGLLLLALLATGTLAGARPARATPTATGTQSLQDLGACLADTKHADVLLLVDTSGSLRRTDPQHARVAAAQLLLRRLTDTAARTGSSIDVAVSGFAATADTTLDWTSLDAGSVGSATSTVAGFARRDDGFETDYWTALTAARQRLVDHRSAAAGQPCQALVLFTDGEYELAARDTAGQRQRYGETKPVPGAADVPITSDDAAARVAVAGRQDICRAGGIADQLRTDRIMVIALGLSDGGQVDFGLLDGIAENPTADCGTAPPYGLFLDAADVSDLVLAFDSVGDPANPPQPVDQSGVCALQVCPQFAHHFSLDASIGSFHLAGTSSAPGIDVYVQPPGVPTPVVLRYDPTRLTGTLPAGDLTLRYDWFADGAFSLDADIPGSGANWSGEWTVTFVDPTGQHPDAVSRIQLTIQADLGAVVAPGTQVDWRVGEDLEAVPFALVRADGSPAALGDPAPTLGLDVVLRSADGTDTPLAGGVPAGQLLAGVPLSIPSGVQPGPAQLRTSLAITTVSGQVLQPQVRSTPITVAPPLGFPATSTTTLRFGTLQGTEPATRALTVTGPGCVWVTGGALQVHPADVPRADVSSPHDRAADCVQVGQGGTARLDVRLASPVSTAGQLRGDVVVHLAPTGRPDRAVLARVGYTAELERPANGLVRALALAGALLLGIGLPVLVFLLGRRLAARLPDRALQSALLDVRVGAGGLVAADGGPVAVPTRWDLVPPPAGGRRRTTLSGVPVRARAGIRLSDAGTAEVSDESTVGVSGAPGGRSGRSLRAQLPLSLHGSWTVLLFPAVAGSADADVPGRLLLVSDAGATEAQRGQILARARAEAPGAVDALRAVVRSRGPDGPADVQPPAPDDPFAAGRSPDARPDPFGPAPAGAAPGGTQPHPYDPFRL